MNNKSPFFLLASRTRSWLFNLFNHRETIYGLEGNYATWSEAQAECSGYDNYTILRKTADALGKVKCGKAIYERDSVLFNQVQYAWPILAGLMWVAAEARGCLNVLDIGGSLGSSYFQNSAFLERLDVVRWNVVEQPGHVDVGIREFQDDRLRFFYSINACLSESQPNVILLSSVLQYLDDPYAFMNELNATPCRFIIIDRTPFWSGLTDRLCIQHVPPEIYTASYPSWIFSSKRFMAHLSLQWELVAEFKNSDEMRAPVEFEYRGAIATRRI